MVEMQAALVVMNKRSLYASATRRSFLNALVRAGAATATACFVPSRILLAQNRDSSANRLIVHSSRPEDFETPPDLLTSWITPNDLFYVRSHFYTPVMREDVWTLRIDGEVERSLDLTLNELRKMRSTTQVVTLECAGNGRGFFEPPVAGVQWKKGAVGNARWTGVRMADLLDRAGIKRSARHIWLNGADVGIGRAPDFIRNVPLEKAMHPDTLLAYEMNDEVLPVAHGFPLRAIVSGWEGAYSVKWLTHLQVADREHEGAFVQSSYRYPKRPVSPGTTVQPADTEPLKGLVVKSIISSPTADAVVPRGPVRIAGFAWAGEAEIKRVDVSTDHGRTWAPARLGRDRAPYAWRQFEYHWNASEPGAFVVLSRAEDGNGRVQPIVAVWNPAGYLWNAIDQVRVIVKS
jgi:DMSO/TMAO reductase YedYZ molybdopterin-dependent catalytic subunit